MDKLYTRIGFLFCVLLLFSCSKKHETQSPEPNAPQLKIYVGGVRHEFNTNHLSQWIHNTNGEGSITKEEEGSVHSLTIITGAVFYKKDVYFIGYEPKDGDKLVVKYWKNGVSTQLSGEAERANAYAITINEDGVIYVGGSVKNDKGISIATYWKVNLNQSIKEVSLSDGSESADVFSITLYNGDVYAAGRDGNGVAKYWINDKDHSEIIEGGHTLYAISVMDDKVYTAGWDEDLTGRFNIKYWIDGEPHDLTNDAFLASVQDIAVDNGDVYVSGYVKATSDSKSVATYWKNGIAHELTDGSRDGYAWGMTIYKGDVYVAGYERKNGGSLSPGNYIAKYWKNDAAGEVQLSDGNYSEESCVIHVSEE